MTLSRGLCPADLFRFVGYCFGIRSERRLCEEVHLNLAYRWFCRLGLEDKVPDHSSFSKNRHGRFRESDVFRDLFEGVVQRCMAEGLVHGEGFAIDASIIRADANRTRGVPGEDGVDWNDPKRATRAVHEYLQALDETGQMGVTPKNVSLTDPAARWTAAPGCPAFFVYSTNYLVDVSAGIIVDVEATSAHRTEEIESTKTMIDRVEQRFDLKPDRLIGDTAYGTGPMLAWLAPAAERGGKKRRRSGDGPAKPKGIHLEYERRPRETARRVRIEQEETPPALWDHDGWCVCAESLALAELCKDDLSRAKARAEVIFALVGAIPTLMAWGEKQPKA